MHTSSRFMNLKKLCKKWPVFPSACSVYIIGTYPVYSESYTLQLGTVGLFLSWVYCTTILGLIPSVGIYILMVDKIATNIFKVQYTVPQII